MLPPGESRLVRAARHIKLMMSGYDGDLLGLAARDWITTHTYDTIDTYINRKLGLSLSTFSNLHS